VEFNLHIHVCILIYVHVHEEKIKDTRKNSAQTRPRPNATRSCVPNDPYTRGSLMQYCAVETAPTVKALITALQRFIQSQKDVQSSYIQFKTHRCVPQSCQGNPSDKYRNKRCQKLERLLVKCYNICTQCITPLTCCQRNLDFLPAPPLHLVLQ
jgi:hypothetical protein